MKAYNTSTIDNRTPFLTALVKTSKCLLADTRVCLIVYCQCTLYWKNTELLCVSKHLVKNLFFIRFFYFLKINCLRLFKKVFFSHVSNKHETHASIFHLPERKNNQGLGKYSNVLYYIRIMHPNERIFTQLVW